MKMTKRLLSLILVLAMVVTYVPPMATQVEAVTGNTTEFAGGSGTAEDPYLISTPEHLYNVRNYLSAHFKMMNDIDLSAATAKGGDWDYDGRGWNPIGSNNVYGSSAFSGVFDGNGFKITGLRIDITSVPSGTGVVYAGLFSNVTGIVRGLTIAGDIYYGYKKDFNIGAIAAVCNGRIENCINYTNITGISKESDLNGYLGGIVGEAQENAVFANCVNCGNVYSCGFRGEYAGGENEYNYAGGIAGKGNSKSIVSCSYNVGNISTMASRSSEYNHGYAISSGIISAGKVTNCYNVGNVVSEAHNSYGYKQAYGIGGGTITNCYYLSGTGSSSAGATALTSAQMKLQSLYSGFDFENVWTMGGDPEYLYPELQCFVGGDSSTTVDKVVNEQGYIEIRTIEDLYNIRNDLTAKYILMNDIDLSVATAKGGDWDYGGRGWNPIGSDGIYGNSSFSGEFNGNGFRITGMRINITSVPSGTGVVYAGLFANVTGTVRNLTVTGNINYSYSKDFYIGSVAALCNGRIENCINCVNITGISLESDLNGYIGGIVGEAQKNAHIYNCANLGDIYSCGFLGAYAGGEDENNCAGGIAGTGNETTIVSHCYNAGNISTKASRSSSYNKGSAISSGIIRRGSVTNCYNIGDVISESYDGYGARIAYGIGGNATTCYNLGKVTGATSQYAISSNKSVNCYYLDGSGSSNSGSTALTSAQMKLQSLYSGFDFENVWTMGGDPEYLYPELQCFALSGTLGIKGDCVYHSTVTVDISQINNVDDTFSYTWYVDDVSVGTGKTYTIKASDIGKKLSVKVTGTKEYNEGTVSSNEVIIGKAVQLVVPKKPELLYLDDNKFEISTVATQEYSIDNVNWQRSGVFENLDPNKTYTVYSRILENVLYLTGESTAVISVGTDRRPLSGKVSITGTGRYGDTLTADVSGLLPAGATFTYEWRSGGTVVGTGKTYTITQSDIGKSIVLHVKGTGDYIGTISSPAIVATKATVQLPNAPVVADKTNTSVTLVAKTGYEYSMDKVKWQDSPVFTGLSAATEYTFYQRVKETDTTFASTASNGTKDTTLKNTVAAPAKPVVEKITNSSVTLKVMDGYEYSLDGLTWQTNNVFTGLKPYTEYSFCQRIAENKTDYASAQSGYTIIITLKNTVEAPAAPTIQKATATSVTLNDIAGYEYSIDGKTWQTNNVFTGLTTLQTYTFYQRIKETNTDYTSAVSAGTSFKVKNVTSAPAAPTLTEKTNNKIVVAVKTGYEYSINKTTWNTTGVFTGLQPNKTYTVYCRIPETDTHYASGVSSALTVTTMKNTVAKPGAPTISSKTSTSVTLVSVAGAEYSKDGTIWQTSNVFTGLSPNKTYTFYQRVAETSTAYASEKSAALTVTTSKNTVSAPSAPTLSAKTSNSVTLVKTSGYEYSKDGLTWQTSNVFENLSPNTTYVFYQRVAETATDYASAKSTALSVTTPKNTVATPEAPVLNDVSATIVVLNAKNGYEYSKDGTTWQDSNVFTGLKANTQYSFYQRAKETGTTCASAASPVLRVKTAEKSACSIKPAAPIIAEFTANKIVLVAREGYEYKIGNGSWTTNTTFSGLSANTSYTVYQRIVETNEEYASAASAGVTVKTAKSGGTTSATNYNALRQYINTYGAADSDGYKTILGRKTQSGGYIYYFVMSNRSDGIFFNLLVDNSSSSKLVTSVEFVLSASSKWITLDAFQIYYEYGSAIDAASGAISADRSTYYSDKSFSFNATGKYIKAADFSKTVSNALSLLCTYFDGYIYTNLGFGLRALGFTSYSSGYGSTICDVPSNYHTGSRELRNQREAGCVIDGYTGDYYCTGCGEKVSSGRSVAAKGSHSYTNSCDKDCTTCGEERRVVHTYTGGCDVECNICNHTRIAVAGHSFNEQKTCTVCGTKETFTVVFKNWDGTVISTKNYYWGNTVTAPVNPTKPADKTYSYTFKGWDKAIVACSGDATYTATYTQAYVDYTVVFKDWNGTVLSSKTYHWGDKINIPANPVRPSNSYYEYTFTGWDKEVVNCAGNATYTAVYSTKTLLPTTITSAVYKVGDGEISKIPVGTTVSDLLEHLNEGKFIKVYMGNKEIASNALIGTGMVVKIMSENTVVVSATIIVTGDTNGDGKLTVTDFVQMQAHLLNKTPLQGAAAKAADTSGDGKISVTDYVQMQAHILGKSSVQPRSV